ncbi:hypothetical protein D3C83_192200 [compost metagenome]
MYSWSWVRSSRAPLNNFADNAVSVANKTASNIRLAAGINAFFFVFIFLILA